MSSPEPTYCQEADVYKATGLNSAIVLEALGTGHDEDDVTEQINGYILTAEKKVKRALGVPITIRKEQHAFDGNKILELGPYEDQFEFFSAYDPANCVERIFAVYQAGEGRVKLPYPKNCDDLTEDITDMLGTNCTLSKESAIKKCGTAAVKAVFLAGGDFIFSKTMNMEKNISPWLYVGFWFRTNDKNSVYTITLYDAEGRSMHSTFQVSFNDTWCIVALNLADGWSGDSIDWVNNNLEYIKISSSAVSTVYFDNFSFNSGIFWTYPEGVLVWCVPDTLPSGILEVTYSFDPYKEEVPEDVNTATSKFAGALLLDYMMGVRQRTTGFQLESDTIDNRPDRETMEITRGRLLREAAACLAGIGYKTYEGIGLGE